MKKIILWTIGIAVGLFIAVVAIFLVKVCLIGKIMDADSIYVNEVKLTDTHLQIDGFFLGDSALACNRYTYYKKGDSLYIKVYGTLVSRISSSGNVNISVDGDFSKVNKFYFVDSKSERLIGQKSTSS